MNNGVQARNVLAGLTDGTTRIRRGKDCVCQCMCIYMCVYVCACTCMYVCMYVCVFVCLDEWSELVFDPSFSDGVSSLSLLSSLPSVGQLHRIESSFLLSQSSFSTLSLTSTHREYFFLFVLTLLQAAQQRIQCLLQIQSRSQVPMVFKLHPHLHLRHRPHLRRCMCLPAPH